VVDCVAIPDSEFAGVCVASWATAAPVESLDVGRCGPPLDEKWQAECRFVLAERWMEAKDRDRAIATCHQAAPFVADCAQHLWKIAVHQEPDPAATRVFLKALSLEFPEAAANLDPDGRATKRLLARERLEHLTTLSEEDCPEEEGQDLCLAALTRLLEKRWEREADGNAEARALLCAGAATGQLPAHDEPHLNPMVRWQPSDALDDAVRAAQASVCGVGRTE
jgi:hypothetical protein